MNTLPSVTTWLVLSIFLANSVIVRSCEDALNEKYELCKKWAKEHKCSSLFSMHGRVRLFCKKSCGLCAPDQRAKASKITKGELVGCYERVPDLKPVSSSVLSKDTMKVEVCVRYCHGESKQYAALNNGKYCFCGDLHGNKRHPSSCTSRCKGDADEMCGGVWHYLSVYKIGSMEGNSGEEDTDRLEKFILHPKLESRSIESDEGLLSRQDEEEMKEHLRRTYRNY